MLRAIPWETSLLSFQKEGYIIGVVYKYTNKQNDKIYIGKTINEKIRKRAHSYSKDSSYFHSAIRKYGYENFDYEVLFRSDIEDELLQKEREFINIFSSNNRALGYNLTDGGEGWSGAKHTSSAKEKMSLSKGFLTKEEVLLLRDMKNSGRKAAEGFKLFSDRISYQAFLNIWTGKRYSHIGEVAKTHTILNQELANQIRKDYETGKASYKSLAEKYNVSKSTIADIIKNRTWRVN